MNAEQQKFINAVILPKLIEMAIDCTLPVDMNELCHSHFEDEAKQFNIDNKQEKRVDKAYEYLGDVHADDGGISMAEQVARIDAQALIDDSMMIDHIDGVCVVERFEYAFTVETFLDQISADYI